MPAGLKIIGDANQIQIDENYSNMSLLTKGTAACNSIILGYRYTEITVTGKTPIMFVNGGFPLSVGVGVRNGNQTTFQVFCGPANQGQQFTYYVFDWPEVITPSGNSGLRVRNSSGNLTFDSSMKYMKVVAVVNCGVASSSGSYTSLPTGRTYAITQSQPAFGASFTQIGGADSQGNTTFSLTTYSQHAYPTSNGFNWSPVNGYNNYQFVASAVPPPMWNSIDPGYITVVDVTNY